MEHTSLNSEQLIKEVEDFWNETDIQIILNFIDCPESIISDDNNDFDLDSDSDMDVDDEFKIKERSQNKKRK